MTIDFALTKSISTKVVNTPSVWSQIEFSLFLVGELLSVPCYIFVFYHILTKKTTRDALHNHAIIVLLFFNFIHLTIDLSMVLDYLRLGYVSFVSPALCLMWKYVDYGIWFASVSMMFWMSIERHILVFHSNLICTKRRRFFIHYIPLIFFSLYAPILYFYLIFLYPCKHTFSSMYVLCGSVCYRKSIPYWLNLCDTLVNYIIPIILIAVFSIALMLRFIRQKRRLRQDTTWRQCRKMIIQLALVSLVYLIFDLPWPIIFIVQSSGYPSFGSNIISPYISHLTYVPAIILPYAVLLTLPNLKQKLHVLLIWKKKRQAVAPTTQQR